MLTKRQYEATTGRDQGERNVLAYQIRQSFKPGEITPEEANRIGYELAMRFTKGKHQFIVATHIDKAHIHNHIIFNSTRQDGTRKFRDFLGSGRAVARISDTLCVENGLSIVEKPKEKGKDYGTWLGDKKPRTYQEQLRQTIEKVLAGHPTDFDDFIQQMKMQGYTVEQGKHVKFKAADQKKYTRLRALGEQYSEEAIKARIAENLSACPVADSELTRKSDKAPVRTIAQKANVAPPPEVNLLIDLQNSLKAKDSPGYMKWAKKFNLKQAAQTLLYLEQHNLMDYDTLAEKATAASADFQRCTKSLKDTESRMSDIAELQKSISNYRRTCDVYAAYRKAGYSHKFYDEHRQEIERHKTAKACFDAQGYGRGGKKIPRIDTLKQEYATLLEGKKKLYPQYHLAKKNMVELLNAKSNVESLLSLSPPEKSTLETTLPASKTTVNSYDTTR